MLAPRRGGVLESDGEVQLAAPHGVGQGHRVALPDGDLRAGGLLAHARDGGGDEPREGGREGTDAQAGAVARGELRQLDAGQLEPLGDRVGVREQDRAGRRQLQAAGPAVEQPGADLALERGDLLRDGRLGQRQLARRPGEGPPMRDGAERQDAARVHSRNLSLYEKHYLNEWPRGPH